MTDGELLPPEFEDIEETSDPSILKVYTDSRWIYPEDPNDPPLLYDRDACILRRKQEAWGYFHRDGHWIWKPSG